MEYLRAGLRQRNEWFFEAKDAIGNVLWTERVHNEIVDEGLDEALNTTLRNQTPTAAWYCGIVSTTPIWAPAPGDVMSSHGGWAEQQAYTEGVRQTLAFAAPTNPGGTGRQSVAPAVTFSINAGATNIGGAFVTSNSAKGGTTGKLFAAADFSALRTLGSGDTLNVTVTVVFDGGI
jgi:hypothetical protein